jgi:hypothetical protein
MNDVPVKDGLERTEHEYLSETSEEGSEGKGDVGTT